MVEDVWLEIVAQHKALRHALGELHTLLTQDRESFYLYMEVLVDFLKRVHTPLEDELAFPRIEAICAGSGSARGNIANTLSRLSADHKLLLTLGSTITGRGRAFGEDVLRERFEQFERILLEHNANEEALYQVVVKECGEEKVDSALGSVEEAEGIIRRYGLERYSEFMRQVAG
ncbi:MAG: hemerythrin domain-containing protein [Thermoprotei archaeon]